MDERVCVSFSGLTLYNQCPSAFARKYIRKEQVPEPDGKPSPAMLRGTRIHRGVELFLLGEEEDMPDEAYSFEGLFRSIKEEREPRPEARWAFNEEWEEVPFGKKEEAQVRGVHDVLYAHDDTAYVIEIKTGKIYDDHSLQRSLYGLAGLLLYPEAKSCRVTTVYLDGAIFHELIVDRSMVETYKYIWQRHLNKVQPPQPYEERASWKCKWCPYNADQGGTCQTGKGR